VVTQHREAHVHAVRYAKHFVWRLNDDCQVDDLTEFEGLTLAAIKENLFGGTSFHHFGFLSHYKVEAGTEATLLRDLLDKQLIKEAHPAIDMRSPIFTDSDDLADLATLEAHVKNTDVLMILLTPGILSRPWCLLEIVTAIKHDVALLPIEVQRPGSHYPFPDDKFYKKLLDGQYLGKEAVALLESKGITLKDVESGIRQVFLKIALPFSPHKTKMVREAEVSNILKRCDFEISREHQLNDT